MRITRSSLALAGLLISAPATVVAQASQMMIASDIASGAPAPVKPGTPSPPVSTPGPPTPYAAEAAHPADCGDALSQALDAEPNTRPCWSNIRTVDRWNTTEIPDNSGKNSTGFYIPENKSMNVSTAFGGLGAVDLNNSPAPHAYGFLAGISGLMDRDRWQLMFEDAGGGGDLDVAGTNSPVGLNRAAFRAVGEFHSRLLWQASAANTYGTDALRLYAPLDYRKVGDAESVVGDTVAYGLHAGRVTDEEEDAKLRYESSRRSNWDFVFGHTLQAYSDDGALIQTERGRVEYLHALSPNTAVGVYGSAERQDGAAPCSLAGSGLRGLSRWRSRLTLSVSGTINGAYRACGNNHVFTGDASLSLTTWSHTSVFVGANRGLSGGVIENTALLNNLTAGIRHRLPRGLDLTLSGAAILAENPLTHVNVSGTFEALSVSYPLGRHLVQEASIRHYQVSPASLRDNRVVFTYTLWFSPRSRTNSE